MNCYVVLAQKKSCNSMNNNSFNKTHSEIITKEIKFERNSNDNIFMIENVNGNIKVEGYGGNTIQVEVEKVIKYDDREFLAQGIKDINLGVFQNKDGVCLYMDAPFVTFNKEDMNFDYKKSNKNKDCESAKWDAIDINDAYRYELNYKVKVPRTVNVKIDNLSGPRLEVSNIKGDMMDLRNASGHIFVNNLDVEDIDIQTMSGHIQGEEIIADELAAQTMSGHVKLNAVSGAATHATSMSGHVIINYNENPKKASEYTSMSGHVDIGFQPGLNADISQVVNNNGKLYSDFTDLSSQTNTSPSSKKKKNSCSATCSGMSKKANYKAGRGGDQFSFSTMNGHVKVRKI